MRDMPGHPLPLQTCGGNFQSGATVQLVHSGNSNINATSVAWVSASHMTCTFTIPSTATTGSWDVVVTNPDGQFVSYANEFIVHGSTSSVTTTTTTAASTGSITISSVAASPRQPGRVQAWSGRLTIDTRYNSLSGINRHAFKYGLRGLILPLTMLN